MALLVLHKLFSLLRAHWSRTRRPAPRNFIHPEPELSNGDPRNHLHRRKVTRSALGVWCDYTIRELLDEELYIVRSEEHTSELQSQSNLVCRLLLEKKKKK